MTLACGLQPASTPEVSTIASRLPTTGGAPLTPPPLSGTPVALDPPAVPAANGFAPYLVGAVDAGAVDPGRPPDLAQIANVEALEGLSKAQRAALAQSGFLVIPAPYGEPVDVYRWAAAQGLPTFLTTDAVLYNVSLLTDAAWRQAAARLTLDLQALSEALIRASLAQWLAVAEEEAGGALGEPGALADAAWRNLAFFSVGGRLLDADLEAPGAVAEVVAEELTLIEQGGVYISPLFGDQQDYGVYEPDADRVSPAPYQRATAWYAQPFPLHHQDPAAVRGAARQVLLMALALQASENWTRWERVYYPTTFFEGTAGGYNLVEAAAALEAVYGEGASLDMLLDEDRLDDFIATLRALPRPPAFHLQPPVTFRLLPRPQQPDEALFRELLFNRVGRYQGEPDTIPFTAVDTAIGPVRGLPRALDVAAALGSDLALSRLEAAGDVAYEGYDHQMQTVRRHVAQMDETVWTQTLGGGWLYAVETLLSPSPLAIPLVEEEIWWNKQLNSWYGAWILLRNPLRSTPGPPAVDPEAGTEAAAYVEPEPLVYARLAALVRQVREGLQGRTLLDTVLAEKLQEMERLLLALQLIAEKQLVGDSLTPDEFLLARQAAERLAALATLPPEGASGPAADRSLLRIADVYVDGQSGHMLQAALGEAWPIYVLVPGVEQPLLAVGALFSTYELRRKADEQLDADAWREMEKRPAPAPWLEEILIP